MIEIEFFHSDSCNKCWAMEYVISQVKSLYSPIRINEYDCTDLEYDNVWDKCRDRWVSSLPAILVFKDDVEVFRKVWDITTLEELEKILY